MSVSVTMPRLGESVTEGTVTRWLKKEGERVEADEPLLEVSTDKVDTEIPAPASGTLSSIRVGEDETVEVGVELAVIDEGGSGAAPASPILPSSPPTGTVSSSSAVMERSVPATGDGISVSTLSVDTSTSGSSTSTLSPTFFSHRVTVPSVTDSPSSGILTGVDEPDDCAAGLDSGSGSGSAGASSSSAAVSG